MLRNRQTGSLQRGTGHVVTGAETVGELHVYIYGEFSTPVEMKADRTNERDRLLCVQKEPCSNFVMGSPLSA